MEEIITRQMELTDIDAVLDIEENSFTIPWTRNSFVTELTKNKLSRYVVAEVNGVVVAYGGMWLIVDEAHITNIAVHPTYRGLGAGKKIVEALLEEGRKINIYRMTLEVRSSNAVAQSLYRQYGFMPCGVRPGYYHDNGEDAIIMWNDVI